MPSLASDPWYDFLAIPIAPLVLMLQVGAMLIPSTQSRRVIVTGAAIVMCTMTIITFMVPGEGANIGAALIVPQAVISLGLAVNEWKS